MFNLFKYTNCEELQKLRKINNYKTKKYTDIKNNTSLEYIFFYFY